MTIVGEKNVDGATTLDGSVDCKGRPAVKASTGRWWAGFFLLGLATLAFFGVGVNLVLFLTRVLHQNNADAANNVSKWTGTVYLFSLVGAFLSDSYWGRYKSCVVFQAIFVVGLAMLSLSSYVFLIKPAGCGDVDTACRHHSGMAITAFYTSVYLVALGNGGYQPNIATFGSDQFEGGDPNESHSKVSFFSYFYLSLNLGSLFSNTIISYLEDEGRWILGFCLSTGSAFLALLLFLVGRPWYRHFRPEGNPLRRISQVVVAASRKAMTLAQQRPGGGGDQALYEVDAKVASTTRRILHTQGFGFLDLAATPVNSRDFRDEEEGGARNPWRLCTVTQVEEVKCILRLLPIWLCTILYSVVFTQMASLFVVQGDAMRLTVSEFRIPASSMSAFDILGVTAFVFLYKRVIKPVVRRVREDGREMSELQRMGVGLAISTASMIAAGTVEHYRLRHVAIECDEGGGHCKHSSSLSVFWQTPQYVLVGASEVFMYVGQLEFFNSQTPDGLKSFGSALCMTSISLGNYVSDLLVTLVMDITRKGGTPGWIPGDLNRGHLEDFFFLLAILTTADFLAYVVCARWYKPIRLEGTTGSEGDAHHP